MKIPVYKVEEKDLIQGSLIIREFPFFFFSSSRGFGILEQLQEKTKTDLALMILEFYDLGVPT